MIEIYLRARRENPPKKIEPIRAFCRGLFWEYGGLKPIPPLLEGRSDAARRIVILPFAVPVDACAAYMPVGGIPRIPIPAMPAGNVLWVMTL